MSNVQNHRSFRFTGYQEFQGMEYDIPIYTTPKPKDVEHISMRLVKFNQYPK